MTKTSKWERFLKYWLNIAIALDQLGHAVCGGDPQETISSHIGKIKLKNGGRIPWRYPVIRLIDKGLERLDHNHSLEAIQEAEGSDATYWM